MPAPTTLLEARTDETNRIKAALAANAAAATAAGAAEAAGTAALTAAAQQVTAARTAVEAARRALAAIPTPADGGPLLIAMRDAVAALLRAEAAQASAAALPKEARAMLARLSARATTLKAALAAAAAAEAAEGAAEARRTAWKAAAVAPPISALPQAAAAVLAGDGVAAAAKIEADIPANAAPERSLLAQIRARRAHGGRAASDAAAREAQALANEKAWAEATTREAAKLPALQRGFDAALAALGAFVNAAPLMAQASATLAALADRPASPLTPAQRAALFATDPAVTAAREVALSRLKARDDKVAALAGARRAYAEGLASARVALPDATEAELHAAQPALVTLHDAVGEREAELATARNALTAEDLALLEAWLAAMPEALWDQLEALDEARAALQAIAGTDPAGLVADLVAREVALAAAMDGARREERIAALLAGEVAASQDAAAIAAEVVPRRRRAAARFVAEA